MAVAGLASARVDAGSSTEELVARANEAFSQGRYEAALELYTAAQVEDPLDAVIQFDIGTALYRLGRFEQARGAFDEASSLVQAPRRGSEEAHLDLDRDAAYNEGNSLFRAERYQQAVELYTRALELDPSDKLAKHNLELARRMMQERAQPRAGSPTPEPRQRADSSQQSDRAPGSTPQPTPQPIQPQPDPEPDSDQARSDDRSGLGPRISRAEAERLLDALEEAEKEARRKRRRMTAERSSVVDW
jgi:Ca-activated chloride channel family protein